MSGAAKPSVQVQHLGWVQEKGGVKVHSFRVTLVNRYNKPVWFVLPLWPDMAFPKNGIFRNVGSSQPFSRNLYGGKGGLACEVRFSGTLVFKAYRLPAKGRLRVDEFTFDAKDDFQELEVLEAKNLRVNAKTRLEHWLPFRTMADKKVRLGGRGLDLVNNENYGEPKPYPKEKVYSVKAEGFRIWRLKFQPKAELDH
jgi:hypothetical protein